MEEQMIFGALQTLNEEAYEDVLEEQAKNSFGNTTVYRDSIGEEESAKNCVRQESNSLGRAADEIDVVYLQSSPLMPHAVFSCSVDLESTAPSVASSFSPYRGSTSLSRASSMRGSSTNASPKHSNTDKPTMLKADKTITFESPQRAASPSPTPAIEITLDRKAERPHSLNLDHKPKSYANGIKEQVPLQSPDEDQQLGTLQDLSSFSSLQDMLANQNGPRHLSLSEQISASSSSSIEKLRKLSKKLHKAFGANEETPFGGSSEEAESSPLVLATPSSNEVSLPTSGTRSPPTNGIIDTEVATPNQEPPSTSLKPMNPKVSFEIDKETKV